MKNKKGFTLIELLVVVSIIGVLSAIVISSLNTAKTQATDKRFQKMIHNLQIKLELYHLENGEYPGDQFASYYDPDSSATNAVSLESLAVLLNVDAEDMYPCGEFNPNCKSSFSYYSPRNGFGDANCWKNHYLIFYTIENPTTPFETQQDYPCGANGIFGDSEVPEFCTDDTYEEWEDWFCGYYEDQEKQYTVVIK